MDIESAAGNTHTTRHFALNARGALKYESAFSAIVTPRFDAPTASIGFGLMPVSQQSAPVVSSSATSIVKKQQKALQKPQEKKKKKASPPKKKKQQPKSKYIKKSAIRK